MEESDLVKEILENAKKIREKSRTSCVELQNYLYYQYLKLNKRSSSIWSCGMCSRPRTETKKEFRRAFNTLTKVEQAQFYLMNAKNVQKFLNTRVKRTEQDQTQIIQQADVTRKLSSKIKFQIMDGKIFKKFTQANTQALEKEKIIRAMDDKGDIDLHKYILRKSKNRYCLALQSMVVQTPCETIRLMFNPTDFDDSFISLSRIWTEAQYENIKKMLIEDNKFPRKIAGGKPFSHVQSEQHKNSDPITDREMSDNVKLNQSRKDRSPVSSSFLKSATTIKTQRDLVTPQLIQSLKNFQNFQEKGEGLYFEKQGRKVRKTFQFNNTSLEDIKKAMGDLKCTKKRKQALVSMRHLNSIPSERTNIYREVNSFEGNEYQFLYLQHHFSKNGMEFFFQKYVNLEEYRSEMGRLVKGIINSCIWRIRAVGNKVEVLVQADISYNKPVSNPQKITALYIGDLSVLENKADTRDQFQSQNNSIASHQFENQFISETNSKYDFYTVTGSLERSQHSLANYDNDADNILMPIVVGRNSENRIKTKKNIGEQDFTSKQTTASQAYQGDYLKHRYQLKAQAKGIPQYLRQAEGHVFWGNRWKIHDNGDLINLEKEKIKAQSSVLKLVLKRVGKNVLSGKGIVASLPIEIYGADSNLQRIARGYIYGPIFLEKASTCQDPIQRMKLAFCFGLGLSIGYIKMEKPFNPTLGQTYQGQVDGCPIYGEQISHHPPICSMLMIGRGYRVYGNYQVKVELGMNYASGINQGYSFIEFTHDNSKVRFNTPPGEMHGIIIGDRRLVLAKKSYYVDEGNRLMCEVVWGKNKQSRRQQALMNDSFSGKIVKVKNQANLSDPKKIKPKDIEFQFGQIHGRFTGKVYYEDTLIFDVGNDAPFAIENYTPCLESDSRNRRDIKQYKLQNYQIAQQAKEEIEKAQRDDKKLRKH